VKQQNVIVASIGATKDIRAAVNAVIEPVWVYIQRRLPERTGYPYEPPKDAHIVVDNDVLSIDDATEFLWEQLLEILFTDDLQEEDTYVHF